MNAVVKTAAIPFLKKITPKTVFAALNPGKDILELGNVRPVPAQVLYDLFGTINGYKQKADDKSEKGVWTQFKGRFRAVAPTGEMWESGATHIPVLEDMILSTFQDIKSKDERAQIEIALRVAVRPAPAGKPSMTGYEYDVQRLLAQADQPEDPIVRLMQASAAANPAQLAAPVAEPTPASPAPANEKLPADGGKHHGKK